MSEHTNPYERDDLKQAYESAYRLYRLTASSDRHEFDDERDEAFTQGVAQARNDLKAETEARGLAESA